MNLQTSGRNLSAHSSSDPTATSSWNVQQSGARRQDKAPDLHVVLVHPEIPGNTGTIARTCAATAIGLHLVKPLGFEIDSTRLKRAGLDYWDYVVVKVHDDWQELLKYFQELPGPKRMHAFTKFATQSYSLPGTYQHGDWLLFGAETTGLPAEVRKDALASGGAELKIPIQETHVRSLNLAVAASVALYEGVRQLDPDM
ncbi:hypothetical protein WJX73_001312 [Symbiochloris irregularis]|uniref:tRNA/rRNA methyltransferase SpoU type domain-containing protein n=1 Tax=Symbiochloris irregularis TaxID=706552 RepID=A0AAW1PMH2_9CHLO